MALGGAAAGAVAIGGGAAGVYAMGGGAVGTHVLSASAMRCRCAGFLQPHLRVVAPARYRGPELRLVAALPAIAQSLRCRSFTAVKD